VDHEAIERFVADTEPPYVIAAPDPEQTEPVKAIVAFRTLTCDKLDVAALASFRDNWIAEVQETRQRQS
jgi:hypothetical protein